MPDELEERLRSHARSLDGLLSLIPAKLYYGEDVSDQWKRKKQTPEQKRAAKMAKLDPDNWKSAKDVMDERAAAVKRKRDDSDAGDNLPEGLHIDIEKPKAQQEQAHKPKKQKLAVDSTPARKLSTSTVQPLTVEEKKKRKAERNAAKQQLKQKQKEKKQRQKERKTQGAVPLAEMETEWSDVPDDEDHLKETISIQNRTSKQSIGSVPNDNASTASSSTDMVDIMSPPAESGTSSISSIQPEQNPPVPTKSVKHRSGTSGISKLHSETKAEDSSPTVTDVVQDTTVPELDSLDKAAARDRLSAAISSLRAQRKADTNPRSRQDLLNARRLKEESRRAAKKEQRRKEREDASRLADEEIERRFSPGGSGSLLGSPRSPVQRSNEDTNNFSFGRIAFADGSEIDPSTSHTLSDRSKKSGPQDVNTALQAAQNKQARLAGLDEQKRKTIEEKDMWLNAKKRAHGERVKDDTSLLKKALKRQESQKKKSEKEWTDRKDGIQKAQEARQKKRTENLAKRKEEKKHGKKAGSKVKKVKRPGFEGSFRGRTGSTKKK